jgi:mono/diheme cytochrome c family protein
MQLQRPTQDLHNFDMLRAAALATLGIAFLACGGRAAAPSPSMNVTVGRATAQKYRCIECHTIGGDGAAYAPDITRAWTRFVRRAGGDEEVARSSMLAFLQHPPNATIDRRQMPDFRMTPAEAGAVVDYLRWTASR